MLGKRFQQQSNITQLYYFLSQKVGGDKIYLSPLSKSWGGPCSPRPPINSVPESDVEVLGAVVLQWRAQIRKNVAQDKKNKLFEKR